MTLNDISLKHHLTPKILFKLHLAPKILVRASFSTKKISIKYVYSEKYVKSHEFWQIIILKVSTAFKRDDTRNIF